MPINSIPTGPHALHTNGKMNMMLHYYEEADHAHAHMAEGSRVSSRSPSPASSLSQTELDDLNASLYSIHTTASTAIKPFTSYEGEASPSPSPFLTPATIPMTSVPSRTPPANSSSALDRKRHSLHVNTSSLSHYQPLSPSPLSSLLTPITQSQLSTESRQRINQTLQQSKLQLQSLQHELEEARATNSNLRTELQGVRKELREESRLRKEEVYNREILEEKERRLQHEIGLLQANEIVLQQKIQDLTLTLNEIQEECNQNADAVTKSKNEITKLSDLLAENHKEAHIKSSEYELKLNQFQNEKSNLESNLSSSHKEQENLQQQLKSLQIQYRELSTDFQRKLIMIKSEWNNAISLYEEKGLNRISTLEQRVSELKSQCLTLAKLIHASVLAKVKQNSNHDNRFQSKDECSHLLELASALNQNLFQLQNAIQNGNLRQVHECQKAIITTMENTRDAINNADQQSIFDHTQAQPVKNQKVHRRTRIDSDLTSTEVNTAGHEVNIERSPPLNRKPSVYVVQPLEYDHTEFPVNEPIQPTYAQLSSTLASQTNASGILERFPTISSFPHISSPPDFSPNAHPTRSTVASDHQSSRLNPNRKERSARPISYSQPHVDNGEEEWAVEMVNEEIEDHFQPPVDQLPLAPGENSTHNRKGHNTITTSSSQYSSNPSSSKRSTMNPEVSNGSSTEPQSIFDLRKYFDQQFSDFTREITSKLTSDGDSSESKHPSSKSNLGTKIQQESSNFPENSKRLRGNSIPSSTVSAPRSYPDTSPHNAHHSHYVHNFHPSRPAHNEAPRYSTNPSYPPQHHFNSVHPDQSHRALTQVPDLETNWIPLMKSSSNRKSSSNPKMPTDHSNFTQSLPTTIDPTSPTRNIAFKNGNEPVNYKNYRSSSLPLDISYKYHEMKNRLSKYKAQCEMDKLQLEKQEMLIQSLQNELMKSRSSKDNSPVAGKSSRIIANRRSNDYAENSTSYPTDLHPHPSHHLDGFKSSPYPSTARLTIRTSLNPDSSASELDLKQSTIVILESELAIERERRRIVELKNSQLKERIKHKSAKKETQSRSLNNLFGEIRHALYNS